MELPLTKMAPPRREASSKWEDMKCSLHVLHFCASEDVEQTAGLELGKAEVGDCKLRVII